MCILNIPYVKTTITLIFKMWYEIFNTYLADMIAMKIEIRQKFIIESR